MRAWEMGAPVDLMGRSGVALTGAAVDSWTSAGNATAVATASGTERPTYVDAGVNGRPALEFDGSNDFMSMTATTAGVFRNRSYGRIFAVGYDANPSGGSANHMLVFVSIPTPNITRSGTLSRVGSVAGTHAGGRRLDADGFSNSGPVGSVASPFVAESKLNWANNSNIASNNGVDAASATFSSGAGNTSNTDSGVVGVGASASTFDSFPGRIAAIAAFNVNLGEAAFMRIRHNFGRNYYITTR